MSRYGATLLRIALGVIFAMNGYFALFVLGPAGTAQAINISGLPLGETLAVLGRERVLARIDRPLAQYC